MVSNSNSLYHKFLVFSFFLPHPPSTLDIEKQVYKNRTMKEKGKLVRIKSLAKNRAYCFQSNQVLQSKKLNPALLIKICYE